MTLRWSKCASGDHRADHRRAQLRPAQGLARLGEDRHGAELRKEIADLSRTPPPATDRLEEQKVVR